MSELALSNFLGGLDSHLSHVRGLLVQVSFDEAEAVVQGAVRESAKPHSLFGGVDRDEVALYIFLAFVQIFGIKRLGGRMRGFDGPSQPLC